jgi:hypothetical protein
MYARIYGVKACALPAMVSLNPCFVRAFTAGDWRPHRSVSGCNAAMTFACEHIVILPNL